MLRAVMTLQRRCTICFQMAEATENTQNNNAWLEQMSNSSNEVSKEETLLLSLSLADVSLILCVLVYTVVIYMCTHSCV